MKTIVLFDIDKTLIALSKAHMQAFVRSIKIVYNVDATPATISYHGMTDQQIIRGVLKVNAFTDAAIDAGLAQCMNTMVEQFDMLNPADNVELLPGVQPLLESLEKQRAYLGLVTGNLEKIAWKKLAKTGADRFFSFGGFGSDHPDRSRLAALAVDRCKQKYALTDDFQVVLIGDTPHDINAGLTIGARTIGVATGFPSPQNLRDAGAHFVFTNFIDTTRVMQAILEGT